MEEPTVVSVHEAQQKFKELIEQAATHMDQMGSSGWELIVAVTDATRQMGRITSCSRDLQISCFTKRKIAWRLAISHNQGSSDSAPQPRRRYRRSNC